LTTLTKTGDCKNSTDKWEHRRTFPKKKLPDEGKGSEKKAGEKCPGGSKDFSPRGEGRFWRGETVDGKRTSGPTEGIEIKNSRTPA